MLGHSARHGLRDDEASRSWNSSHPLRGPDGGCSETDLPTTGGAGLFIACLLLASELAATRDDRGIGELGQDTVTQPLDQFSTT